MGFGEVLGSVIGAAGSLFGGKKDRDAASQAQLMSYLTQKEFAQHGIRWKVEDAKAAGLHPLFALGGGGATFTPSPVALTGQSWADAGQHLGRAASAALTKREVENRDLQNEALRAKTAADYAQAAYWESEAARNRQSGIIPMDAALPMYEHQTPRGSVEVGELKQGVPEGQVVYRPSEVISTQKGKSNVVAGRHATFAEIAVSKDGTSILWPHQGGQPSEEVDILMLVPWVQANIERYGFKEFLRRYMVGQADYGAGGLFWDAPLVEAIARGMRRK
jgi:hypothetical protein